VVTIEDQRLLEAPPRPRELFAGQARVANTDVELYRVWVEGEAFAQDSQRFVVLGFVVERVRAFIVLLGTHERSRHLCLVFETSCFAHSTIVSPPSSTVAFFPHA
jgi:hypothetical protein